MGRNRVVFFFLGATFILNALSLSIGLYKLIQVSGENNNPSLFKEEIREEVLKNKLLKEHKDSLNQAQNQ